MRKKKQIYIFIDDMRLPPKGKGDWTVVSRSYETAIMAIEKYKDEELYISFDHDLGENKTGYDIAKYLVENNILAHYQIHSANPVGRFNINQLLQHYGYQKFDFLKNL